MAIKDKNVKFLDKAGYILGTGFISNENSFVIQNGGVILFSYVRFDSKAFNVNDSNGTYVGVIRESSLNNYNQIESNVVTGQVVIY